jgi:ankyrin repeat protein
LEQVDKVLYDASKNGDLEEAKRAIENGADVNVKNDVDRGLTPLHKACFNGKVAVISLLLEKGANVNAQSKYGSTPLDSACYNGYDAVVALLLENGADIHAKNDNGQMPLHTACFYGHAAVVSILLEKGANINAKSNDGWTPLHEASYEGHGNIISLLVGNGADVNAKDYFRDTPLHKACQYGKEVSVSLLLKRGADVNAKNKQGWTPLHWACVSGYYDAAVSLLLENGADPTITDNNGKTPLQLAQEYNKQNCVAAIEQFQPRFYCHLDEISTLVQHATENEFVSLVPTFEKALNELSDFLQLKYYFTAVNAQCRLGTITTEDRNRLILAALEKAKVWCVSPFHVAMYRVALRYSLSENIITQFQLDRLDVASLECDIAHTDYIQAMQQMIIRQNAARIKRLENSLSMFQQAVVTSVCDLQQNVIAVNKNVQNMHRDMHGMAVAIIDTQAALKKFKASLEFKRKVEAGCSLVTAV